MLKSLVFKPFEMDVSDVLLFALLHFNVQDLVVQYEVQVRGGPKCGGAYVKVREDAVQPHTYSCRAV